MSPSTADMPVTFTAETLAEVRRVPEVLRLLAAASREDWCPVTVDFYRRAFGKDPIPREAVAFADEIEADLAVNFPPAITFEDKREIARRIGISRASVRQLLGGDRP